MAVPGVPQNLAVTQGNRTIALQWDLTPTALSYSVQRSSDGVTYSVLGTSTLPSYLDSTPVIGTMYWYKVAGVNGDGTGAYTSAQQMVAAPNGEMSLYQIRLMSKQKADRVNSNFVKTGEWNSFIGLAMKELYDILITAYEDYFAAPPATFTTNGTQYQYPLPDGATSFINDAGQSFVAQPFYKLLGVDLALNNAQNAWVTMGKFQFLDRNKYLYPNSNSTIYGWQNAQYRLMGNNIQFIPNPAGNQRIRLNYIPRMPELIQDTDLSTIGYRGWLHYAITRAAIYALNKEESDISALAMELADLRKQIETSAINRDVGLPDKISDSRSNTGWSGSNGWPGFGAGM